MPSDTKQRSAQWFEKTKATAVRFGRFLGRVFKPGGWRYLRPVESNRTPDTTAEQLLKATEQLTETDAHKSQEKPRSKRAA